MMTTQTSGQEREFQTIVESTLPIDWQFSTHDQEVLRRLAGEAATLAARPIEAEKRDLWQRHNALEATRPLIFCDPENSWNEIIPPDQLMCETPTARDWEMRLRKQIFWGTQMGDDYTIQPYFSVPHVHSKPNWGLIEIVVGGEHGGAYRWEAPIKTEADIDKLHHPEIKIDFAATDHLAEQATKIFGDLLKVQIRTAWWWTLGMTWTLANLRGLEQIMYDMIDHPEMIHRIMSVLRDGTMTMLDDLQARGLLSTNSDGTYVGSGALGWANELERTEVASAVHTQDMWGFAESQETVAISPRMFAEFVLPYQLPLMERFRLNCYGCCEPLDKRWHLVKQIPRLRRVSVSPFSNRQVMAENLSDQYIFSMKPNPADLAMDSMDEDRIRSIIRRDLEISQGCRVEMVMKDNHTIRNDPHRVIRWVQIAREEAERFIP